ncbi:MAG: hypothetical protein F4Y41_15715 [Gammaproteobacteria bacterium]|nr:hypothetical protein [Gammaproteobacteria bacterium]
MGGITMNSPLVIRASTITLLFALGVAGCSGQESTSCADAQPAPSGAAVSDTAADGFPRTATGKPDFSGTYDVTTLTPYSRDPRLADRLFFTEEEVREREKRVHDLVVKGLAGSDPDRDAPEALTGEARDRGVDGPPPDAPYRIGSHDLFWFDCGGQFCNLFKIDGKYPTSILIDPPNGQKPAVSDAGKARRATLRNPWPRKYPGEAWWLAEGGDPYDNPEGMTLRDRCMYFGEVTVPIQPTVYNNMKTIVQSEDHVLILIEWMHWPRIVRIDSEHLPPDMMSLGGDSIGWWEGDTLLVETTNFLGARGVPREGLRVVERFSPLDGAGLLYNFTVHDPDHVAPYTGEFPWPKSDKRLYEYACHEGNYSMVNTLRGARVLEAKWIEEHGEPN